MCNVKRNSKHKKTYNYYEYEYEKWKEIMFVPTDRFEYELNIMLDFF